MLYEALLTELHQGSDCVEQFILIVCYRFLCAVSWPIRSQATVARESINLISSLEVVSPSTCQQTLLT